MIITLSAAKLHLRVDHSDEDALITSHIKAAEALAMRFMNRNVYADQPTLDTAKAAAPAALTTATAAYDAAVIAAEALTNDVEKTAALEAAEQEYLDAQAVARMTRVGTVLAKVDGFEPAVLLTVGHLYANREDVVVGASVAQLPLGAQYLIEQYKVYR